MLIPPTPPRRPRLRADYTPIRLVGDEGPYLLVRGETRNLLIEDPAVADLAVALDGTRDVDDVLARLSARYQARTAAADLPGVALTGNGAAPSVVVAVTSSMTDPALAEINAACLRAGLSWTLMRPHGHVLLLGPHLVPGQTGCWECLRRRWAENEQLDDFMTGLPSAARPAGWQERAWPALAPLTTALTGLLAAELPVLALRGHSDRITGQMVALDPTDLTISRRQLVRQPCCPACGEPDPAGHGARVTMRAGRDRRDDFDAAAGQRAAATARRLEHHVSSYLGGISRLLPVAADDGMFSYSACHPFVRPVSPADLRGQMRGLSGGKGPTEAEARVSAMAEAIERYCGTWRPERPERQASFEQHGGGDAVRLSDILLFSPRQYANRRQLNPGLSHFHRIPEPLADDAAIGWTDGWSLTNDRPVALPAAPCWYGHPSLASAPVCGADSNGCAAGDSLEDAVRHGFCELAERDSVALWWYHRSVVPGVDLHSSGDPWIGRVHEMLEKRLGREPGGPVAVGAHEAPRDAAACVRRCVDLAQAAGLEVIVVDQSRPDIELAVARVIVPGLRHFWRRLGPGRLWDGPAKLGRLPVAADEESVNPYGVFF